MDINTAIAELQKTFEQFRDTNQDIKADLGSRITDLENAFARQKFAAGGHSKDAENELAIMKFLAATQRRDVAVGEYDAEQISDYKNAFSRYLRVGEAGLQPDIRNALSVGSDPDGGYWVEPAKSDQIIQRIFESSPIRQLVDPIVLATGDALEFPTDTNDAVTGGWVAETAARGTTATPQVGQHRIPLHEQFAQPEVTQKLLDLASFDVEGWLGNKIADKIARDENTAFVSGDGIGKPTGFLNYAGNATTEDDSARAWGVLEYTPSGAAGAFPTLSGSSFAADADALITLQSKLKPAFRPNAVWMMNRSTSAIVRKLKDADGRYLWLDSLILGQPDTLLGSPVVLAEDMPDVAADSFSIAYGDFRSAYTIADGPGTRVLRDPFTNKPFVRFYSTKRVGADVTGFDSLKLMKFAVS